MRLAVGDPAVAAIEVDIEEPRDEQWIFGRFRLIARGEPIGDWDDVVTLRAVVAWWRSFTSALVDRWDEQLEGLTGPEIFERLRDAVYAETADLGIDDVFGRFHVNQLGMSAFDPFVVLLVEPPGGAQWLLWRREDGADGVHDARLPVGTLQALGAKFVAAFEAQAHGDAAP
jgi:hypothetical protein